MSSKHAIVLVAPGTEEMEAVIVIDVLRRAGIEVSVVSIVAELIVECSRRVQLQADQSLLTMSDVDLDNFDCVVLPGGLGGAESFKKSEKVLDLITNHYNKNKLLGVICAYAAEVGFGKRVTSHPCVQQIMESDYQYSEEPVVSDGNLVTSRGPGTAFAFAFELVAQLTNEETVEKVKAPMMFTS